MNSHHRVRKRATSSPSRRRIPRSNYASSEDLESLPGTATYNLLDPSDGGGMVQEPVVPRRRRAFSQQRREEVAKVRIVGACDHCRNKKIRVSVVPLFILSLAADQPSASMPLTSSTTNHRRLPRDPLPLLPISK
jgi:hypothetical protein